MEQIVRVREVFDDGSATVIHVRESACSGDCHKCSGCGAAQQTVVFRAINAIGAKAGQLVTVRSESGPVLAAAAVLYLMPLLLFFAGYIAGMLLWQQGAIAGCAAFVLGIVLAAVYDRKVVRKRETVYTITGFASRNVLGSQIKGDNDLD